MIELFEGLRDILVELHARGLVSSCWVAMQSRSMAIHALPKNLGILVEPNSENAQRVYAALAAFGAPLSAFEVTVEDFAAYDGVLQLGASPTPYRHRQLCRWNHVRGSDC